MGRRWAKYVIWSSECSISGVLPGFRLQSHIANRVSLQASFNSFQRSNHWLYISNFLFGHRYNASGSDQQLSATTHTHHSQVSGFIPGWMLWVMCQARSWSYTKCFVLVAIFKWFSWAIIAYINIKAGSDWLSKHYGTFSHRKAYNEFITCWKPLREIFIIVLR